MTRIVVTSGPNKTYFFSRDNNAANRTTVNTKAAFIQYRASTFATENAIAKANYNIKGVRAVFDPDLGPSGGYRCPRGTQYGGYITDRFGRGCGGGIIRRVGRALASAGMRLEDFADRRDERRRNRAVQRRLKPARKPGERRERIAQAMERGARRLVDAYPVENLGPSPGGRAQRRNIPAPPKKRTAVVKPKPKPKRVVKPAPQKKPARPQGKAPIKPPIPKKKPPVKNPVKKISTRNQGAAKKPETIARELISSKPKSNSRKKFAQIAVEGIEDRQERRALLDALINNIEEKLQKIGELPDLSKLSGEERKRAERKIEEMRGWMSELNAAKRMRKNIDSGPATSQISRRMRDEIDDAERGRNARGPLGRGAEEQREAARSARSEISRRRSKPTISKPVQRTSSKPSSQKDLNASAVIPGLRVEKKRKQVIKPFATIPDEPGKLPIPKHIVNPEIQTVEKAKQFFDDGGDLNEIPEQFWHEVLKANSVHQDPQKRRVDEIIKNGGIMKQVEIFVFKGADQGIVFNRERGNPGEAVKEAMAQNVMVALGLNVPPARMDGNDGARVANDVWAVMPFVWNFAPPGRQVGVQVSSENFLLNALEDLPDHAVRERLAHFLFNFAMGITDRHDQNGMAQIFEDSDGVRRAHVVPIDMAWFDRGWDDLFRYANGEFRMDQMLFNSIKEVIAGRNGSLSTEERIQLHQDILNIYDEFNERLRILVSQTNDDFVDSLLDGYNIDEMARIYNFSSQEKADYIDLVKENGDRLIRRLRNIKANMDLHRDRFIRDVLGGSAPNA